MYEGLVTKTARADTNTSFRGSAYAFGDTEERLMRTTIGVQGRDGDRAWDATAGTWGGACICGDGQIYQVGDEMNLCGSLACHGGGMTGLCNQYDGEWARRAVTCAQAYPSGNLTPTERSGS